MELWINNQPLDEQAVAHEWQPVVFTCVPASGAALTLGINGQPLDAFLRPGDDTWHWQWNPQNAVGRFALVLRAAWPDGTSIEQRHMLDVVPRKIDQEHYTALLADLQATARQLVYALTGGGRDATVASVPDTATLIEQFHLLFGERFDVFERAVERIAQRPPDRLCATTQEIAIGQAQDFAYLRPGRPSAEEWSTNERTDQTLPATVAQQQSTPTFDSYENRLLKRLLDELWRRTRTMTATATLPPTMTQRCAEVQARLVTLRRLPFLAEVAALQQFHGPTTLVQRDPHYRMVYRMWRSLHRFPILDLDSPLFTLPLHELPRLYECWCAVQLVQLVLDLPGWQVRAQRLVAEADGVFTLPEDEPLLVLENAAGQSLRVRYQPRYRPIKPGTHETLGSLDRHTRIPDVALEIVQAGHPTVVYIFDAKYRLDARGGVPEDALADAYVYRGSIGLSSGAQPVQSALLFYPGTGVGDIYPNGVGALPLLPGASDQLRVWLSDQVPTTVTL